MRRFATVVVFLMWMAGGARGDVYQHGASGKNAEGKDFAAYLWVPAEAEKIRAVLIAGMGTSVEPMLCEAEEVRKACREEGIAIVYMTPHPDAMLAKGESVGIIEGVLEELGRKSGHAELKSAPFFVVGHSVSTVFASKLGAAKAEKCAGIILHKGGIALGDETARKSLKGVPILAMKGQFEEFGPGPSGVLRANEDRTTAWKTMHATLATLREDDATYLVSLVVVPGGTHFPWLPMEGELIAEFLRGAMAARVGADGACKSVETKSGVLTPLLMEAPKGELTFDRAFWQVSAKMAERVNALHAGLEKKAQFVSFADGKGKAMAPGHDLRLKISPKWTGADTFSIGAVFVEGVPLKYPAVEPVAHAEGEPQVILTGGQLEAVEAGGFRFCLNTRRRYEGNLVACHAGDATYRYAEQAGIVSIPRMLTEGKAQVITFADPGEMKADGVLKLGATSDSGLPVRYFVEYGPAVVVDGELRVAEIPKKGPEEMKVMVVAYQFGSAVEPKVQTAEVVRREVILRRLSK